MGSGSSSRKTNGNDQSGQTNKSSGTKHADNSENMFKAFKQDTVKKQAAPTGEATTINATQSPSSDQMSWRQILDHVANLELWDEHIREERERWRDYLERADVIVRKQRKPIPRDVVRTILEGDMASVDISRIPNAQPKVIVFVSSTFTDTKAERNHLMKDVYPYLRTLCRRLGMDFGTVDMRWGVTEEATMDHSTVDMCVNEIQRCIKDSAGPAFLCFLCHKYGYRPLPAQISQSEFNTLLDNLNQSGKDTALMTGYYRLDKNALPPEYVLKPNSKDNTNWWNDVGTIQECMRIASVECFGNKNKRCDKYHISVTETEIHHGFFNNPKAQDQASFVRRELTDYLSDVHKDRKIIDMDGPNVDEYAQEKLRELKKKKLEMSAADNILFDINYEQPVVDACCGYMRHVCDHVCETLTESVLDGYDKRLHVEEDSVFQEALQHRNHAVEKAGLFLGRESEMNKIKTYIVSPDRKPLVIHGVSGCGKTSLMAAAAIKMNTTVQNAGVLLRFLGTSGQSASARSLLLSVCTQITRIYSKDVTVIPTSYKELNRYFRSCLSFASENKPLIILLDSLDQLSNEDFGQNLSWLSLSEHLPVNVKLVVSTLPTQCLDILKANLPDDSFVEVLQLRLHEGPEIMTKMLAAHKRTISDLQRRVVIDAFKTCPLPLFIRLVVDIAVRWHSYDDVNSDDIADDMSGMITMLFERLESRYGELFVRHALSYITAAKYGLSLAELEDLLSCDDKVLNSIFKWWVPPVRRMPPLLWTRVRNELGIYLAERGTDGVNAYGWYHRQFWETAEKRYLNTPFGDDVAAFKRKAHEAIADYFDGKWENGKPYTPKSSSKPKLEDRKIPKQPIVLSGDRKSTRQLNKRKLSELPYHIIQLQDWERFQKLALNLEYIEAKFEAGFGYNCLSEFIEATKLSEIDDIKQMTRFIGSNIGFLIREPSGIYQMALQQSKKNIARKLLESMNKGELPLPLMVNKREEDIDDPCEMTLQGHTETIRSCHYSPRGDLIVSSADDGSMRTWDTTTGAELVNITSLPFPVWPDKNETEQLMMHPVNPCCFSRNGNYIANGTEHGGVMLCDTSGVQLKSFQTSNKAVTSIQFSPDDKVIATSFKHGVVSFWSASDLSQVTTVNIGCGETTCLDYSPDGTTVAVMCILDLVLINTSDYKIRSQNRSTCYRSLCCVYHPSGKQIMTGGDYHHAVSAWDAASGVHLTDHPGHSGWIWSISFTTNGEYMFTGSSDRFIKVWHQTNGNWVVKTTVGGHSHRVSMVSLQPGSNGKMVTASLDRCLKVWDVKSLIGGNVPPTGRSGHFTACVTSPNSTYISSCHGGKQCRVFSARDERVIGNTEEHLGIVKMTQFTPDESRVIVLDMGHLGDYKSGKEVNARVKVTSLPELQTVCDLDVQQPTSFSVNSRFIFVGTLSGSLHLFDLQSYVEVNAWNSGMVFQSGDEVGISRVSACHVNDMVAACCSSTCKVWKASDSHCTHIKDLTEQDSQIRECTFSPDGHYLIVGTSSGRIYIWDTSDTNVPLFKINSEHASYIRDIKFSRSGQYMVTSAGLSMRVWNVNNDIKLLCTYYSPVSCASFIEERVVLAGEATGIMKYLSF